MNVGVLFVLVFISLGCSSPFLKYEKMEQLKVDEELPVEVKEISSDNIKSSANEDKKSTSNEPTIPTVNSKKTEVGSKASSQAKKNKKKTNSDSAATKVSPVKSSGKPNKGADVVKTIDLEKPIENVIVVPPKRLPEYESSVGFPPGSRRPSKDPFRVGEKVTMLVSYFKAKAGEMTLEVRPFVEVNGKKSYRWYTSLKTIGVFSSFYSVEDWSETMVDFENLVPSVFNLNVRESSQLKQAKGYIDNQTLKAKYYEKKYTEKNGQEEKRQEWLTLPFSQNVFSAAFYMRVFNYEVGKEYAFNVADDEKNVLFKAKCLRKEKLETDAGTFDTIVIQPNFEINGVFKPMGEIYFWLSDDDRKFLLRIESDIKIGTIVAEALRVDRGEN
jgi:hypothetical protein